MYTGQRHDSETGLMYFKNRYYSTLMGQFVTRDPLGYVDGLSMYLGYFGGNGVDPFGNYDVPIFEDSPALYAPVWDPNGNGAPAFPDLVGSGSYVRTKVKDARIWTQKEKDIVLLTLDYYKNAMPLVTDLIDKLIKELKVCGCEKIVKDLEKTKSVLDRIKSKLDSKDKLTFKFGFDPKSNAFVTPMWKLMLGIEFNGSKPGESSIVNISVSEKDPKGTFFNSSLNDLIHELSHGFLVDHHPDDRPKYFFEAFSTPTFEQIFVNPKSLLYELENDKRSKGFCKKALTGIMDKFSKESKAIFDLALKFGNDVKEFAD